MGLFKAILIDGLLSSPDKINCNILLHVLLEFSLTVRAATLIFISGCGSAISSP